MKFFFSENFTDSNQYILILSNFKKSNLNSTVEIAYNPTKLYSGKVYWEWGE